MRKFLIGFISLFLLTIPGTSVQATGISASHITGGHTQNISTTSTSSVSLTQSELELIAITSRTEISTNPNQPTISGDGLTWVAVSSIVYDDNSGSRRRETVLRAMGTPITGALTIDFGGQTQTDATWTLDQFSGVDTSGSNGSGAIVQSAQTALQDGNTQQTIIATLAPFSNSNNAAYGAFGFSGNDGPSQGSGFTQLNTQISSTNLGVLSEFKDAVDTTVDASITNIGFPMGMIGIELKATQTIPTPTQTPTPTFTPTPTPTVNPTATPTPTTTPNPTPTIIPTPTGNPLRPDHIVVVVEENRQLQQMLKVGYFTSLANQGALLVNSSALTHPSQPNYFELFSGSNQGVTDDTCPPPGSLFSTSNIGQQLLSTGSTFAGYTESMSANPRTDCSNVGGWDSNHTPWVWFSNIPLSNAKDFSQFPSDFTTLPTVAFVIPNLTHDAHDGTIQQAADWLQTNIDAYAQWAKTHNSLLIVTSDEDDEQADNTIYTTIVGQHIVKGLYNEPVNHYNVLSTIEWLLNLNQLNPAAPVTDIFN